MAFYALHTLSREQQFAYIHEVAQGARDLLSHEAYWTTGYFARSDKSNCHATNPLANRWSLTGAFWLVTFHLGMVKYRRSLLAHFEELAVEWGYADMATFNDSVSFERVQEFLDTMIRRYELPAEASND